MTVSFTRRNPPRAEYGDLRRYGLFEGVVFGPVRSRRLGVSLGINPFPSGEKICSFDCPYCECGRTTRTMAEMRSGKMAYPDVSEIGRELTIALTRLAEEGAAPDAITFAGNGEPTLHPDFPGLVDAIRRARSALAPRAQVVLLTNATLLGSPRIRDAAARLDEVSIKLDAGTPETMTAVDLPLVSWTPDRLVQVARDFPRGRARLVVQAMFLEGATPNTSERDVAAWIGHLRAIAPDAAEIYTLDRAPDAEGLRPVAREWLEAVAARAHNETGVPVRVT